MVSTKKEIQKKTRLPKLKFSQCTIRVSKSKKFPYTDGVVSKSKKFPTKKKVRIHPFRVCVPHMMHIYFHSSFLRSRFE